MRNSKLLLGALLSAVTITVIFVPNVSSKSLLPNGDTSEANATKVDHDIFFKTLTPPEQQWIAKLSIMYHDADISPNPNPILRPARPGQGIIAVPAPIPLPWTDSNDVPQALVAHFLNGNVPKHWQKEFTKWLKKDYKMTETHFNTFRTTGSFCVAGDPCMCGDISCHNVLDNLGGLCCPFG